MKYAPVVNGISIPSKIFRIKEERCAKKFPQKGRGKRPIRKEGTIVGAYAYAYWHPHCWHSYHIVWDDGTCDTVSWKELEFIG